jgi:hypothetical protein
LLLVALAGAVTPDSPRVATAADSETAAIIWHFNVYRVQNGLPPFYTHPDINTLAQEQAQHNADTCGISYFAPKPAWAHKWTRWNETGGTADTRWADWMTDPEITGRLLDPEFNSAGVGRASSRCGSVGIVWSAVLGEVDGVSPDPNPTPTGPVAPTPTAPNPTTRAPTPTPSATSTPVATPTPAPTASVTPPASASSTPYVPVNGDADCDGQVLESDGILVLFLAADFAADTPCLGPHGVDCTGLVDQFDVLALFRYLGGLDPGLPPDCPALGAAAV